MKRDRIANEKIINFHIPAARAIGTSASAIFDLRAGTPVVGAAGSGAGREINTNILLALQIGGDWAAAGTINVRVFTGNTVVTLSLYATGAQCLGTEGDILYLFELRDLQRYIRVDLVIAGATCLCSMLGSADRSRREPVYQAGTEKAITYSKNPASF